MKSLNKTKHSLNSRINMKWANILGILLVLGLLATPATQASLAKGAINSPAASPYTWTTEVVDGPPFFYMMTDRSLRYDKSASPKPCAAYGGDHLYYSCWNSIANTWTTELVDNNVMVGAYAALAFNNQNIPIISYYDALNARLKLAIKFGFGWEIRVVDDGMDLFPPLSPPETIDPENLTAEQLQEAQTSYWDLLLQYFPNLRIFAPGFLFGKVGVGKHTSIDVDTINRVHISYYDELNGALKYALWDLNNYPDPPIREFVDWRHDGDLGLWTSIVTDWLNRPQISYMDEKYDDLKYAIKQGGTWTVKLVDNGVNVGPFSSIALEPGPLIQDLYPHIVYMSFNYNSGNFALKYAHLQNDNTSWTKGVIDGSSGVGLFASLTIDKDDIYHVSYYDGLEGDLLYMKSSNGTNWGGRMLVASVGDQGFFTSIAFNANDDPAIAFVDATNGIYKLAYKVSNTWNTAAPIGTTGNVGLNTSLAISSLGVPHISYLNETMADLKYARAIAANWSTEVITNTAYLGTFHSIDLDAGSKPHVAYYEQLDGDLILTSRQDTWREDFVTSYRDVGAFVSLAIDSSNVAHMSYIDQTQDWLMYAHGNIGASNWITETRDIDLIGGYTSISTDGVGLGGGILPGISYYDFGDEDIKLAYQGIGQTWERTPVYSLGIPNDSTQILEPYSAMDFERQPAPPPLIHPRMHVAFYDEVTGNLRYAIIKHGTPPVIVWSGIVEGISNPDLLDVGRFVSLVIDRTNNNRHLCYYDTTNGDLKYAFFDGTWADGLPWDITSIDSVGDVGMYCSIDLNGAGQPGISYYDASNADLKFARTYSLPPVMVFIPIVIRP